MRTENCPLNFRDLGILDSINEGNLGFRRMILQFLGCVFFSERRDFIEVHLQVMSHLLRQIILWRALACQLQERWRSLGFGAAVGSRELGVGALEQLAEERISRTRFALRNFGVGLACLFDLVQYDLGLEDLIPQSVNVHRLVCDWSEGCAGHSCENNTRGDESG